jgi:secondary thiamine-phosphate synthase enzyme
VLLLAVVFTKRASIRTRRQGDAHDITDVVAGAVRESACRAGIATAFVVGSTAAITTIEFETGAIADFDRLLERLAPRDVDYQHHLRWHDDNGSSHVRAALLGPSVSIPFENGELVLGTWQQVLLLECDTRGREREIVVQVMGE